MPLNGMYPIWGSWFDGILNISNVTMDSVELTWSEATDESGIAKLNNFQQSYAHVQG